MNNEEVQLIDGVYCAHGDILKVTDEYSKMQAEKDAD